MSERKPLQIDPPQGPDIWVGGGPPWWAIAAFVFFVVAVVAGVVR